MVQEFSRQDRNRTPITFVIDLHAIVFAIVHVRSLARLIFLAPVLLFVSCGGSSHQSTLTPSSVHALRIEDLAASAAVAETQGIRVAGTAPAGGTGPTIAVTGNHTILNGGTPPVSLNGASAFQTVYMYVGGKSLGLATDAAGGVGGYYEIRLPSPTTTASVLLTFPQTIPLSAFDLLFAAANTAGTLGPYATLAANVTTVGTGDIQVTLSWDVDSDVDLHVDRSAR